MGTKTEGTTVTRRRRRRRGSGGGVAQDNGRSDAAEPQGEVVEDGGQRPDNPQSRGEGAPKKETQAEAGGDRQGKGRKRRRRRDRGPKLPTSGGETRIYDKPKVTFVAGDGFWTSPSAKLLGMVYMVMRPTKALVEWIKAAMLEHGFGRVIYWVNHLAPPPVDDVGRLADLRRSGALVRGYKIQKAASSTELVSGGLDAPYEFGDVVVPANSSGVLAAAKLLDRGVYDELESDAEILTSQPWRWPELSRKGKRLGQVIAAAHVLRVAPEICRVAFEDLQGTNLFDLQEQAKLNQLYSAFRKTVVPLMSGAVRRIQPLTEQNDDIGYIELGAEYDLTTFFRFALSRKRSWKIVVAGIIVGTTPVAVVGVKPEWFDGEDALEAFQLMFDLPEGHGHLYRFPVEGLTGQQAARIAGGDDPEDKALTTLREYRVSKAEAEARAAEEAEAEEGVRSGLDRFTGRHGSSVGRGASDDAGEERVDVRTRQSRPKPLSQDELLFEWQIAEARARQLNVKGYVSEMGRKLLAMLFQGWQDEGLVTEPPEGYVVAE